MKEDKIDQKEMNKVIFANLVMMLGSLTMQSLGKLLHPETGKTEVNLEAAQATIDTLLMLKEKTAGNLDDEERRLLGDTLSTLQLNFVETASSTPSKTAATVESAPATPEIEEKTTPTADADPKGPKKDPKYHKSYGA